jgi:hypothetical protein
MMIRSLYDRAMAEFLVEIEIELPPSMPDDERTAMLSAEAERGRELRDAGSIVRMCAFRAGARTSGSGRPPTRPSCMSC